MYSSFPFLHYRAKAYTKCIPEKEGLETAGRWRWSRKDHTHGLEIFLLPTASGCPREKWGAVIWLQNWLKPFFALWSICVADTAWGGVTCTAGSNSSPALSTLAWQKWFAICWAQSALSSKHPGPAGPWGLTKGENEWKGKRRTKLKINPCCIAEFVFPMTGAKCKKKRPCSTPLFGFACSAAITSSTTRCLHPTENRNAALRWAAGERKWKEAKSDREGKCKGSCKGLFPGLDTPETGVIQALLVSFHSTMQDYIPSTSDVELKWISLESAQEKGVLGSSAVAV